MDLEKFTRKSQEALLRSQEIAAEFNHQELQGLHLFIALVQQKDGLVPALFSKAGINVPALENVLTSGLRDIPQVTGAGAS
jgi:ATP-dependent Clp protease ATP-binding subunit ClpB